MPDFFEDRKKVEKQRKKRETAQKTAKPKKVPELEVLPLDLQSARPKPSNYNPKIYVNGKTGDKFDDLTGVCSGLHKICYKLASHFDIHYEPHKDHFMPYRCLKQIYEKLSFLNPSQQNSIFDSFNWPSSKDKAKLLSQFHQFLDNTFHFVKKYHQKEVKISSNCQASKILMSHFDIDYWTGNEDPSVS